MSHPAKRYLRTPAAAAYTGYSPLTLEKLRVTGGGPPYSRPHGRRAVLYDVRDLDRWVRAGRRRSTSDEPGADAAART